MELKKKEILRYLGYNSQKIDSQTNILINESIKEVQGLLHKYYIYKIFDIEKNHTKIHLKNTHIFLEGKDIYKHLFQSEKCVILAVTLGNIIDQKIRYYSKVSLSKSLIFDACATTAIEAITDSIEEEIIAYAKENNFYTTYRYSPGYGDFPLSIQPEILKILDAHGKIGLISTPDFLLLPRKSVTAIIGLQKNPISKYLRSCKNCNLYHTCTYKKEGNHCEHKRINQ
ncbi:vitamin B12 dependent-methionine synthase activation domain-containing protein [Crassaminicella profunda]|uniref:vitamin B12 dependent-methionine synthase activation domain-containing protein n=1 Tax=Crassaminicella profunda TaxID=1286698 RepID=UPI001CA758CC|nr:vitamin B12 dependent-methionine synthase activation domain-containing protein [Crassaminicella profunda]QZY56074.1 methionine synthase [Crassaminicella profunda]